MSTQRQNKRGSESLPLFFGTVKRRKLEFNAEDLVIYRKEESPPNKSPHDVPEEKMAVNQPKTKPRKKNAFNIEGLCVYRKEESAGMNNYTKK